MKCFLFLTYSFIFSCLFLFFLSPRIALAKTADCYVGGTKIGTLRAHTGAANFFIVGLWTDFEFTDNANDVANPNEVSFRLGSSSWFAPYASRSSGGSVIYDGGIDVGSENCGNVWANVTWRSVRDGQMHYCSALSKKYTQGEIVRDFVNTNCIYTAAGCVKSSLSGNVKQAALLNDPLLYFSYGGSVNCSSYRALFRGTGPACGSVSGSSCRCTFITAIDPEISSGEVTAKVNPSVVDYTVTSAFGDLFLYNFISNTTCGSGYSGGIPATPTPTPVSCPLAIQSMSFSGSGTPLMNDYNTTQYKGSPQYTLFTANKNGKVTKAEIYGTLDRNIPKGSKVLQCKITNSTGTTTLGESATNNEAFTKGVSWMGVSFPTPVNIVSGTSYRLYCKVNNVYGGGLIYWLDNYKNRTDKAYKLYMCNN